MVISSGLAIGWQESENRLLGMQAYFILLCFTLLHFADIVFFTNWRFMATLRWASISAIFPTAFAQFMSLCCILVILTIFQTVSLLLHLLWWSVISDLWSVVSDVTTTLIEGLDDG